MKSVAIMQPTFLPWVGYFALMNLVDEFVFLDHVQFDKRSWQQRNRIKTANGPVWLTVPVATKGKSEQSIKEAGIKTDDPDFPAKIIKTIEQNYSKTPFYGDYAPALFDVLSDGREKLLDLNIALIEYFRNHLSVDTPLKSSSDMDVTGQKSSLLVDICKQIDATSYISPPGSREYLESSDDFEKAGIPVTYFEYNHPEWAQPYGDFEPYMSALDLLFNMGDKSSAIMQLGVVNETSVRHTGS